jgi:hypothetical protein
MSPGSGALPCPLMITPFRPALVRRRNRVLRAITNGGTAIYGGYLETAV